MALLLMYWSRRASELYRFVFWVLADHYKLGNDLKCIHEEDRQ